MVCLTAFGKHYISISRDSAYTVMHTKLQHDSSIFDSHPYIYIYNHSMLRNTDQSVGIIMACRFWETKNLNRRTNRTLINGQWLSRPDQASEQPLQLQHHRRYRLQPHRTLPAAIGGEE